MLTQEFKGVIESRSSRAKKFLDVMYENWSSSCQYRYSGLRDLAVRLVALLDDFVSYYMEKTDVTETRFPVFYMPTSKFWAREIAVEFLMLKMSLTYNGMRYNYLRKQLNDICLKRRLRAKEKQKKKFIEDIRACCDEMSIEEMRKYRKNVFVGNLKNSNTHMDELVRELDGVSLNDVNHYNLFKCDFDTDLVSQVYDYRENTGFDLQIENIFLFFGENFNRESANLNKKIFDMLRDAGCNVKNVFVFRFSERPYQARKILEWKKIACKVFLQASPDLIRKEKNFVSFAKDELDYIFGRECNNQHLFLEDVLADEDLLEDYLSSSERPLVEKNDLSLCFNEKLYNEYCAKYSRSHNDELFQKLSVFWRSTIIPKIMGFISDDGDIAVVVNNSTFVDELKNELQSRLSHPFSIKRYDIKDLKRKKINSEFSNNLLERKVLVFQYWKHDLQSQWIIYPNSFDSYFEKECIEQKICEFINGNILGGVYKWHLYGYNKELDKILYSEYRRNIMKDFGGEWEIPERIDDDDMSPNDYVGTAQQIRICYANYDMQTVSPSTYYLYEYETQYYIDRIDVIKGINGIEKIQPLDDFAKILASLIDKNAKSAIEEEIEIRERIPNLTEAEKHSSAEVWKILLKKFVDDCGKKENDVYQEIERNVAKMVSFSSFQQWINPESNFILPREKSHQRYIFNLLKLPKSYLRLVRRRKAATKRATGSFNRLMDSFLKQILVNEVNESMYSELSENDIFDLLNLENMDDLQRLQLMLKEKIHLNKIRSIEYA